MKEFQILAPDEYPPIRAESMHGFARKCSSLGIALIPGMQVWQYDLTGEGKRGVNHQIITVVANVGHNRIDSVRFVRA